MVLSLMPDGCAGFLACAPSDVVVVVAVVSAFCRFVAGRMLAVCLVSLCAGACSDVVCVCADLSPFRV